jgi:hypothetical protein
MASLALILGWKFIQEKFTTKKIFNRSLNIGQLIFNQMKTAG